MSLALAYWVFIIFAMALSWRVGGHQEKWFVTSILIATLLTQQAQSRLTDNVDLYAILIIDSTLLLASTYLALKSHRFWPIWFTAFLSIGVISTLSAIIFPTANPGVYEDLAGFWAIPAILAMAVGVVKDNVNSSSD